MYWPCSHKPLSVRMNRRLSRSIEALQTPALSPKQSCILLIRLVTTPMPCHKQINWGIKREELLVHSGCIMKAYMQPISKITAHHGASAPLPLSRGHLLLSMQRCPGFRFVPRFQLDFSQGTPIIVPHQGFHPRQI